MLELQQSQQNQNSGMMQVAQGREAQSVQAAMVIAQRFPRDMTRSYGRIIEDCKRKTLAEKAVYSYPRGGTTISGPSIRLAESMARNWGNLDFGIVELERKPSMGTVPGESVIMSYCYDLETNTKSTKVFTVRHARDKNVTKNNVKVKIQEVLTDERDIYEMVANQGARRLRACILSIIPVDIVESAVEQCEKTMEGGQGPLIDRVRSLLVWFTQQGITQDMVEKRLQHKIEATSEAELVGLRKIATSLKDNFAKREDFFELPQSEAADSSSDTKEATAAPQAANKDQSPAKAKSIKNFAPQTPQEAEQVNKELQEKKSSELNEKDSRDAAIMEVLEAQGEYKITNKELGEFVKTTFGKMTNNMTTVELKELAKAMAGIKK